MCVSTSEAIHIKLDLQEDLLEIELELTQKLPPCLLAMQVLCRLLGGEKTSAVLPGSGPCVIQYQPDKQNAPTGAKGHDGHGGNQLLSGWI